MRYLFTFVFTLITSLLLTVAHAETLRIKDLGKLQGWRDNPLVGIGIVTGLAGTGDAPTNHVTRQALANALTQFNLVIPPDQIQSRNVAVVMVNASLAPFAREGDTLDVTVTSTGDARSLLGGNLLLTPLKAANGRTYALAQGPLAVGGYRYDTNGNVVQKNHPTVGEIPNGATVEVSLNNEMLNAQNKLTFVLADPDYTTASHIASAMNKTLGGNFAQARDASGIDIAVPTADQGQLVNFIARLENIDVQIDRRAKVVVNERTGTVVSGGDVRISPVVISHGDLKISISNETTASQPLLVAHAGSGVRTALVTNTDVTVNEKNAPGFLASNNTVADLVQSLAQLKTNTRDVISILRAIKAAGALHAELIIQ